MNWQTKKLGEVCYIVGGGTPSKANSKFYNGDILWATVRDMKNDVIIDTEYKITRDAVKNSSSNIIPRNNVIIATRVGLGKVCLLKYDTAINQDLKGIIPKKVDDLDTHFLYLWVKTVSKYIEATGTGATVKGVKLSFIKNLDIPLPRLSDQMRIVKVMNQVFEKIEEAKKNVEKNVKNSYDLFESYLNNVFSRPSDDWEYCSLNTHIRFIDYRGKTPRKTTYGMRLITAKNVKPGFIRIKPEEFVDPKIYDKWMVRGIPRKGDVLFTTEAPLANVAQLDTDEKVVFAQRIIILQPNTDKINQAFLKYLLLSRPIRHKVLERATGATAQGIKSSLLKKIEIYFPKSLIEQNEIVKRLDELSEKTKKLEEGYKKKLIDLEELKGSILTEAFAGRL